MKHFEYIIVGAGPAGLQLAYFLNKENRDYVILEKGDTAGVFFNKFPVHRKLISINKVHTGYEDEEINLRWDWNSLLTDEGFLFKQYTEEYFPSANLMVDYLKDFATEYHLNIEYNKEIISVKKDGLFYITDKENGPYSCNVLIMATGVSQPYIPKIEGIQYADNYFDLTIEKKEYINKRVLIIGKANSAFETADHLIDVASSIHLCSPNTLKMAWDTHYVGHLRAVNNNMLDTYHLKSQNAVLDANIMKIESSDGAYNVTFKYSNRSEELEELVYDKIILCAGFRFDNAIFDETCKPALTINDRLPDQTAEWESVNIKDLYFIGTIMQMRDFKKFTSGFIHGFRYNVRFLSNILKLKYKNEPLSCQVFDLDPEKLTSVVLGYINKTSALWQQQGFFCDVLMINGNQGIYYKELTRDYVKEILSSDSSEYFTISLEYGEGKEGHSSMDRIERKDHKNAANSKFLHPVIRHYQGQKSIGEHHIIEDLMAEWKEPEHIDPLFEFFQKSLQCKEEQMY